MSTRDVLNFIADFGEAVVLLPAALAVAVVLFAQRRPRMALEWGAALLVCAAVTFLLKEARFAPGLASLPLRMAPVRMVIGPSGHASLSAAFYGGLAVLAWRAGAAGRRPSTRWLSLVPASLAPLISWSVWVLGWHRFPEIAAGTLLGSAVPLTLWLASRGRSPTPSGACAVIAAAGLLIAALHGLRLDYTGSGHTLLAAVAAF